MKIDLSAKLTDPKGNVIKDGENEATLGSTLYISCISAAEGDNHQSGQDRYKLGKLTYELAAHDEEIELSVEQIATLKERVGKVMSPAVVYSVWTMLESK